MKKKILIIVLPIVLVLIVLTGILLYVYLPPKDSNFRIDLQVDDIGFDDEITLVSDDKSGNMVLPGQIPSYILPIAPRLTSSPFPISKDCG